MNEMIGGGDIRKFAKRVISRREERLKHRIRPGIRPSYNVYLKGNRWQSVKLKSQDPITSISISPEVGTNGCGEVTPRVNKRIRRNRSFHIRFSLFDVLEIVDGGNFRTRKSLRTRCLEQRKPQNRSWKLDDLSLSLSLQVHCTGDIPDEQLIELFREMERTSRTIANHFSYSWTVMIEIMI